MFNDTYTILASFQRGQYSEERQRDFVNSLQKYYDEYGVAGQFQIQSWNDNEVFVVFSRSFSEDQDLITGPPETGLIEQFMNEMLDFDSTIQALLLTLDEDAKC